jgi:sec-independent protein translocase protein TatB
VFDLSLTKLLVLAVIALVVFGPKELPKIAAQAGRALRDLRRIAEGAKADLKEGLGPEFQDFDFEDLNPKRFVQKHLLDEPVTTPGPAGTARAGGNGMAGNGTTGNGTGGAAASGTSVANGSPTVLQAGEDPPFDLEAT